MTNNNNYNDRALFKYSDQKGSLIEQNARGATSYFIYLIVFVTACLAIYSLVMNIINFKGVAFFTPYMLSFLPVVVIIWILYMSARGRWSKLGNLRQTQEYFQRVLNNECTMDDDEENAINVYEASLDIIIAGEKTTYSKYDLVNAKARIVFDTDFYITFLFKDEKEVSFEKRIPLIYLKSLLKSLNCPTEVINARTGKAASRNTLNVENVGGIIVGLIFTLAGGVVTYMSYQGILPVPTFFGVSFCVCGLLAFVNSLMGTRPIVKMFITPTLAGIMFMSISSGLLDVLTVQGSYANVFDLFAQAPPSICLATFFMLGLFFIFYAIKSLFTGLKQ